MEEAQRYRSKLFPEMIEAGVQVQPLDYCGIAQKRKLVGEQVRGPKFLMMDDDLRFYTRVSEDQIGLRKSFKKDVVDMVNFVEGMLDRWDMSAVSPRAMNNKDAPPGPPEQTVRECYRAMRVLGFKTDVFCSLQHERVQFMEDFDLTLQLLQRGRSNGVVYFWAHDQAETNLPGGCSSYRNHYNHAESARRLAELHPGLVTLKQKQNKGGGEFGNRVDVSVKWKQAFEQGTKETW